MCLEAQVSNVFTQQKFWEAALSFCQATHRF